MTELREAAANFTAAARWVASLLPADPSADWSAPALGAWDLRALVGHTSRALLTVEAYLAAPVAEVEVGSAAEYFERVAEKPASGPDAVLLRGIEAGEALGDAPAAEFAVVVERVVPLLTAAEERSLTTAAGGMHLSDYLPTREFELVVHGLDIAGATGLNAEPPRASLRRALELAAQLAARSEGGAEVLAALTGRAELGPGFSVLP